jgi:hypothetical protein
LLPEHHFDISVSTGQPVKYSHKLLFALFEAVDAVLTREDRPPANPTAYWQLMTALPNDAGYGRN